MLKKYKNIFIVGIKGVAMAHLAVMLKQMGKQVTGSDVAEEFPTDEVLRQNNIAWSEGFAQEHITDSVDAVIYSAAHGGLENPQVQYARALGIDTLHQAQVIGEIMGQFEKTIAVCGSHGKTTTSSLLSYALIRLQAHPSYLVGSTGFTAHAGGVYRQSDFFVAEADEYGLNPPSDKTPKFHVLHPSYILATNIDFDHPDVFDNIEQVKQEFLAFFGERKLFLCGDDAHLRSLFPAIQGRFETFGYAEGADMRITSVVNNEEKTEFYLLYKKKDLGKFEISVFGEKNVSNAAGAVLALMNFGFSPDKIREAIKGFGGAARRFEKIAYTNDTYLFDDYAHHPAEIEATIKAAKARFPNRRIVIIFQPHTYSRTALLKNEFAQSLSSADVCLIAPIFASARERADAFSVSSQDIETAGGQLGNKHMYSCASTQDLLAKLEAEIRAGDVVFTMGAGDIYKLKHDIIRVIGAL